MIERKTIDDIRKNVDIVEIIGSYISLSRAGAKNFRGLCPFHDDKNPSLIVSQDKQIFTCFSCGATGSVFKFVQEYEHISFPQSIKRVCELAHLPIPKGYVDETVKVNQYQRLNDLMNDLAKFYMLQLQTQDGLEAKNYVTSRNLNSEDVSTFQVGYSPADGEKTVAYLHNKNYTDDEIISVGVASEVNGRLLDKLKGRVIFPLLDPDGNVIGFSGRRIKDGDGEKYINTPQTVLFNKSNTLYNYKLAKENTRLKNTYVVEGFMDAIALYKCGLKSVVATMGTAFTSDHIKLLKSLRTEICLFFDADGPGQDATAKAVNALKNSNITFKVVRPLKDYKDIDECLKKDGSKKVVELANIVIDPIEWEILYLSRGINFNNHSEVKEFVEKAVSSLLAYHLDEMDKDYYFNKIASISKVNISLIKKKYDKALNKKDEEIDFYEVSSKVVEKTLDRYEQAEHQILKMLIENPSLINTYNNFAVSLCSKTARQLVALINETFKNNKELSYAVLMDYASNDVAKLLGQLYRENYPAEKLENLVEIVSKDYAEKLYKIDLKDRLDSETDLAKQTEIARRLIELRKQKGKK